MPSRVDVPRSEVPGWIYLTSAGVVMQRTGGM